MIDINELRRLAQAALAVPDGLSAEWMDRLGQFQEAADASVISELLDRLEAAEKDSAHQKALAASALRVAEGWERKCGELRAKIEAMERQEPVGQFIQHPSNGLWEQDGYGDNPDARPLYALPGAQNAPKAVAYLDLGVGGYMDIGTDLTDEELATLPKGRHMLGVIGTYGVDGYVPAQRAPDVWLPIPGKHPTFDPVDLQLSDGSVLCGCVPQADGDYWWEGPSGEVFIDPKYASVTHWRLAATPEAKP